MMKLCTKCGDEKDESEFATRRDGANGGLSSWCNECVRQKRSLTRQQRNLWHNHRLLVHEYEAMLKSQGGVCAGCKLPARDLREGVLVPLSVDHNHTTSIIRGLLCKRCNTILGLCSDSALILKELAAYLEKHS